MKKLIIMSALVMGGLGIKTADAQFGIHINLHLGNRPVYVPAQPVEVVDEQVYNDDYYYLPDVEAYYNVNEHCYYYNDGDRWISAAYLPGRYHDYDWRYAKHYEIHADRPYMHNDVYRSKFGGNINRDAYYARAYPNSDRYHNDGFRGHDQYDNRGWGEQNRGGFDRHDDRNQNAYNQPAQNRNQGGYGQPSQGGYNQPAQSQNQGGYSQPAQNQGGCNSQNSGRNQGGNNGSSQSSNNGNSQPSQGQQVGHGNSQGQGQGTSQPANHNGGQNSGGYTSGDHYAANKMGMVQDRAEFARPVRN